MVYVADTANRLVRKLTKSGVTWTVSTIAGIAGLPDPGCLSSGTACIDGAGSSATFNFPGYIGVDASGAVFVTDNSARMVRKVVSSGSGWVVSTVNSYLGYGGCNPNWFSAPMTSWGSLGLGIDASGQLYVFDETCKMLKSIGAPPPPPPSPPPLPVQSFFSVISCPAATHRFTAAAGVSGIADAIPNGGWTGQMVQAGPGAPLSTYGRLPNPRASNVVPASADPYDSAQRTWVFKGSQGMRLAPGAGASAVVGGAGGLSFAIWFRADDADQRLRDLNTVMSLTLVTPSGGNLTITLTVAIWGNLHALNLRGEKCCRVGQNGGLDYQDYESDYGASGRRAAAAGCAIGRAAGRESCVLPACTHGGHAAPR